ncbi:MAG: poly-beta-1,6-N-acetyl-D-glucosamine biosynthesis protein PgaD [Candidatus Parcubacteria bacterium]|nr:poly-beta-1,6-N-acetyl-D-glucosamine biosynthesis protein PgaD [Burkholderiales bacterium]
MTPPIIDRADLQTWQHKSISAGLTLVFWALWFYLWLPLLALIAWLIGLQQAYKYMIVLGGYHDVLRLLGIYSVVILLLGGSLYAWATYNILRYGKLAKRSGSVPPSLEQVARHFRQGPMSVSGWRQARRLLVTHDDKGGIASVDILG